MFRKSLLISLALLMSLWSGFGAAEDKTPRILTMGDSLLAWHGVSGRSVSHVVANELKEPVENRSIGGARVLYGLPVTGSMGMKIAKQYTPGDWEWVVLNGGGNDLWLGCGCKACDKKMDRMISADGKKGAIPGLIGKLRSSGAQVVFVGYLRSPGVGSVIDACRDEGDKLEARIAKLAKFADGVHFLSLAEMVPHGDRSFHTVSMIHPSIKGSREIGKRVAEIIRDND
ncbi:GDSL-like Lipase/Acylhydrolase family protein [Shimia gijangensis]|uniref:GDSL-like Lipase/Acylhydrolase family protein n=1 Tax=Shimia gijangensis TaxID=1470563 RepID=A0A1M6B5N3_9RHOB|nr:SGNH/GDSL hydrolase family protein [Shimia gijangensis]SHI44015.1 GDSL-like Lipase/Acylhydrolase family protein [Shimia gijangensis]